MLLKRLTKSQVIRKAEEVRPHLEPYAGETVRAMLEHIGVWMRLQSLLQPACEVSMLSPDEQRRAVLAGLFEKARSGDASAARAFNEMLEKQVPAAGAPPPAGLVVQIVPYDIPDKLGDREGEAV